MGVYRKVRKSWEAGNQSVVKPPPELTVRSKRVAEPTAGSEGGPARQDADALAGGWEPFWYSIHPICFDGVSFSLIDGR